MSDVKRIVITPELAEKLLAVNYEGQRRIRKDAVRRYAQDMASGGWNNDAGGMIVISSDGNVIDGQHRLKAVIMSGVPVEFLVMTGADPEAFGLIDSGMKKTLGDVVGLKNANVCASIATVATAYEGGATLRNALLRPSVPRSEALRYAMENSEEIEDAAQTYQAIHKAIGKGSTRGIGAAVMLAWSPYCAASIREGISRMIPEDERIAAYKMLMTKKSVQGPVPVVEQFALTTRLIRSLEMGEAFRRPKSYEEEIDAIEKRYESHGRTV